MITFGYHPGHCLRSGVVNKCGYCTYSSLTSHQFSYCNLSVVNQSEDMVFKPEKETASSPKNDNIKLQIEQSNRRQGSL